MSSRATVVHPKPLLKSRAWSCSTFLRAGWYSIGMSKVPGSDEAAFDGIFEGAHLLKLGVQLYPTFIFSYLLDAGLCLVSMCIG